MFGFTRLGMLCGLVGMSLSCAGPRAAPGNGTTTTPATEASQSTPATESAPPPVPSSEVEALMTDVVAPVICPRLIDSFIGLPGEETAEGRAAGTLPSVGRWWLRRCEATVENGRLSLAIGGPGWTWVERETSGFRIRQYLLFDADAAITTELHVAYDRGTKIASLWMTPPADTPVTARIVPNGNVTAEATDFLSSVVGAILPITGASADDRARAEVERIGSERLAATLREGFTMTLAVDRQQMDFMVGALPRGQVPERPFSDVPGSAWLINQRSRIYPGGVDVIGPIARTEAALALDTHLEQGGRARMRVACAEAVKSYLEAKYAGSAPTSPEGVDLPELAGSAVQHLDLPAGTCPLVLLVSPAPDAADPVVLRYLVTSTPGTPASRGTAPSQTPPSGTAANAPSPQRRSIRIQIVSVGVHAENAAGRSWDLVGGGPDPYVVAYSVPARREIDRTPALANQEQARFSRWLPGAWAPATELPIRFSVFDEDATQDELIGTAELTAEQVPSVSSTVTLRILSEGVRAVQTGTLELRIETAP